MVVLYFRKKEGEKHKIYTNFTPVLFIFTQAKIQEQSDIIQSLYTKKA